MRKKRMGYFLLSILPIAILYAALSSGNLTYNATPSYPTGLYLVEKSEVYRKNDLVLICPENNTLFEKNNFGFVQQDDRYCSKYQPLIKKIVGVAGDQVSVGKKVFVNGSEMKNSQVFTVSTRGDLLHPCYGEHNLSDSEIWIMSDFEPRSYDSRYFCALSRENIIGKVRYFW